MFIAAFAVPLLFASTGGPHVLADSTDASKSPALSSDMMIVLSLKEAENLFLSSFDADSVFGKQDRHHAKEAYWTPTRADVAQAEASLAVYAKSSTHSFNGPSPIDLSHYFRQYAGIMRGNKKIILINAFPADHKRGISAYAHIPHVSDGGFAFFHAAYNPETHKIQNFEFNNVG